MSAKPTEQYPQREADKRRDAALAQALSMPPIPHANPKKKAAPKRRSPKKSGK